MSSESESLDGSPEPDDQIDVLKQAIEELEKTIEEKQPQSGDEAMIASQGKDDQHADVELDLGEFDSIELGSTDLTVEPRSPALPRERSSKPDPFEQLGEPDDEPVARSPGVNPQVKPESHGAGQETIASHPIQIRKAKLSSLTSTSAPRTSERAQAVSDPTEALAPESPAADTEEKKSRPSGTSEEEAVPRSAGLAQASLTIKLIIGGVFLAMLAGMLRLSLDSRNREDVLGSTLAASNATASDRTLQVGAAIATFWNEPDLERKSAAIWQATRVAPLMREYYEEWPLPRARNLQSYHVVSARWETRHSEVPEDLLVATVRDEINKDLNVILRPSPGSYLIDWEATVGYNEHDLSSLVEQGSPEPVIMRVLIIPADYYNFDFSDEIRYQSFAIEVADDDEPVCFAFAERKSETCAELLRFFANRDPRLVAVTLKLDFGEGNDTLCAEILGIEKRHWAL